MGNAPTKKLFRPAKAQSQVTHKLGPDGFASLNGEKYSTVAHFAGSNARQEASLDKCIIYQQIRPTYQFKRGFAALTDWIVGRKINDNHL
jgi:hypothetical protein